MFRSSVYNLNSYKIITLSKGLGRRHYSGGSDLITAPSVSGKQAVSQVLPG